MINEQVNTFCGVLRGSAKAALRHPAHDYFPITLYVITNNNTSITSIVFFYYIHCYNLSTILLWNAESVKQKSNRCS